MDMTKNIIMLIVLLILATAIILGIHYLGSQVDNKSKYQHPISQPGARW